MKLIPVKSVDHGIELVDEYQEKGYKNLYSDDIERVKSDLKANWFGMFPGRKERISFKVDENEKTYVFFLEILPS
jgi:hypothetical protein